MKKVVTQLGDPQQIEMFAKLGGQEEDLKKLISTITKLINDRVEKNVFTRTTVYAYMVASYFLSGSLQSLVDPINGIKLNWFVPVLQNNREEWDQGNKPTEDRNPIVVFNKFRMRSRSLGYKDRELKRTLKLFHRFSKVLGSDFTQLIKELPILLIKDLKHSGEYTNSEILLQFLPDQLELLLTTAHEYGHHKFRERQSGSPIILDKLEDDKFAESLIQLFNSCFSGRAATYITSIEKQIDVDGNPLFADFPSDYSQVNLSEFHSEIFGYTFVGLLIAHQLQQKRPNLRLSNDYILQNIHEYFWIFRQPKHIQKLTADICGFDIEQINSATKFFKRRYPQLFEPESIKISSIIALIKELQYDQENTNLISKLVLQIIASPYASSKDLAHTLLFTKNHSYLDEQTQQLIEKLRQLDSSDEIIIKDVRASLEGIPRHAHLLDLLRESKVLELS